MPRKSDVIEAIGGGLTLRNRGVRTSLTFRRVRTSECNCGITELCDSSKSLVSEETADSLEREHVYKVYNEIAGKSINFSNMLIHYKPSLVNSKFRIMIKLSSSF